jgi:hypothetical protein
MLEHALGRGIYDAVTVVHSETSTGALNPIAELAKVTGAAGDVVLLVDSVSGAAGAGSHTPEHGGRTGPSPAVRALGTARAARAGGHRTCGRSWPTRRSGRAPRRPG